MRHVSLGAAALAAFLLASRAALMQEGPIIANAQKAAHERCPADIAATIDQAATRVQGSADSDHTVDLYTINTSLAECNALAGKAPATPVSDPFGLARLSNEEGVSLAAIRQRCQTPTEIGMSESQVRASCWGPPNHINRTETAHHTSEQWVYDDGYLYFEDGILVTKQN